MNKEQLRDYIYGLGGTPREADDLLELVEGSGQRDVGTNALNNVVVRHCSKKNGDVRVLESHTVERTCALELELRCDVLAYYCQPQCVGVSRNGGKHVTSGTLDFLVITATGPMLLECKARSDAEKLVRTKPEEWRREGEGFSWVPYAAWAASRGIGFKVWVPPSRVGIYLANLELMYELQHSDSLNTIEKNAVRLVELGPRSIAELMDELPRFTAGTAARLLASGHLHGPIREVQINDVAAFTLFATPDQAQEAERIWIERAAGVLEQPQSRLMQASLTDLSNARRRLAEIDRCRDTGERLSARLRTLACQVEKARAAGQNPLEICLTKYVNSGNRVCRLTAGQRAAMASVIKTYWTSGKASTQTEAHMFLKRECKALSLPVPSIKSFRLRLLPHRLRRALATGGKRAYQAALPASDPLERSIRPQARHLKVVIDSTQVDTRLIAPEANGDLLERPILYVACDAHTGEVMAHAFVFGPARRDGLALLMRDYVVRHGCLPHQIQIDRGPENTSHWLQTFCERYRIGMLIAPTASSRTNGLAENTLGRVNSQYSQRLKGSTAPDRAGRSVDGKFKSYRTAALAFMTLSNLFEDALYDQLFHAPDQNGLSPSDYAENATELFPQMGLPTQSDEEFLWMTSIPIDARALDSQRGLRYLARRFTSAELLRPNVEIIGVRRNPANCEVLLVQTTRGILKVWSSNARVIAGKPPLTQTYHSLMWMQQRNPGRESKDALALRRFELTQRANASGTIERTAGFADAPNSALTEDIWDAKPPRFEPPDFDALTVLDEDSE